MLKSHLTDLLSVSLLDQLHQYQSHQTYQSVTGNGNSCEEVIGIERGIM